MRAVMLVMVATAFAVAGCQTTNRSAVPSASATSFVDGAWTFGNGQFTATFRGGAFNSKFVGGAQPEQVSAGEYTVVGNQVNLKWISFRDREERSAVCRLAGQNQLSCQQSTGQSFSMTRA